MADEPSSDSSVRRVTENLSRRALLQSSITGLACAGLIGGITNRGAATGKPPNDRVSSALQSKVSQTRSTAAYSQQQKLFANDGDGGDLFGESVAVSSDGSTALISADVDNNSNGDVAGSVYVFVWSAGTWTQQQKLLANNGNSGDLFGESVAVSSDGSTAIIGADEDDDPNGANAGSVYVFVRSDGTWTQQQKLSAADGDLGDEFGRSVAVSSDGSTVIIGAHENDEPNGTDAGSVYVFTRSDGSWTQQQKLSANDGDDEDLFGGSVAVSSDGTTALIGAKHDEDPNGIKAGSAYVFTRSDGSWTQQQKLSADDGDNDDLFGGSVAVSSDGSTALVGAREDEDPNGDFAGSAYVFTHSDGSWTQQQKLSADDGDNFDFFGDSVAVSSDGSTILIGANEDDDPNGDFAGSAYVFSRSNGTWTQQQKLSAADGTNRDFFGGSVAVSSDGSTVLIGARKDGEPNGIDAGSAYVFTTEDSSGRVSPSMSATVQQAGSPDRQARVQYTLTNVSEQLSVVLEFTNVPQELSVNTGASETGGTFGADNKQIVFSDPSDELTPTIAFDIAADASAEATFSITGSLLNETGEATDTVETTVGGAEQDPLVARFGGDDDEIGNFDVLKAVNAANSGGEIGGKPVSNLDVLQLVNRLTS